MGLDYYSASQASGCETTIVPRLEYLSGSRFRLSDGFDWLAQNECGHFRDGKGHNAVLWGVDEALGKSGVRGWGRSLPPAIQSSGLIGRRRAVRQSELWQLREVDPSRDQTKSVHLARHP